MGEFAERKALSQADDKGQTGTTINKGFDSTISTKVYVEFQVAY